MDETLPPLNNSEYSRQPDWFDTARSSFLPDGFDVCFEYNGHFRLSKVKDLYWSRNGKCFAIAPREGFQSMNDDFRKIVNKETRVYRKTEKQMEFGATFGKVTGIHPNRLDFILLEVDPRFMKTDAFLSKTSYEMTL